MYEILLGRRPFEASGGTEKVFGIGPENMCCSRGKIEATAVDRCADKYPVMVGRRLCIHSQILYGAPIIEEGVDIWARDLMQRFLVCLTCCLVSNL